jgi:hypothetical protein
MQKSIVVKSMQNGWVLSFKEVDGAFYLYSPRLYSAPMEVPAMMVEELVHAGTLKREGNLYLLAKRLDK